MKLVALVVGSMSLGMASGGLVGELVGLPDWLIQLIVQMPLVALFFYREGRERKDRKTAQAKLEKYLLEAPDKLIKFTESHREAWSVLEKKIDSYLYQAPNPPAPTAIAPPPPNPTDED